tara:strand:+ start:957 stop:1697 length:741 start_codon:yes stop_codon:yes gene_type:complete
LFSKREAPWHLVRAGKISIWIAGLFVAVTTVYLLLGRSALLDVEEVKVYGLHHVTLEEVQRQLSFQAGDPLLSVDGDRTSDELERIPWIKSAEIARSWRGLVEVEVSEHVAIALVMTEPQQWALVSTDGAVLTRGLTSPPELPRISGVRAAGVPGSYLARDSAALLALLNAMPSELSRNFSSIRREADGDIVGTLGSSQEVIFGDDERLAAKIIALSAVIEHLEEENRTVNRIDVAVPEVPVVRNG